MEIRHKPPARLLNPGGGFLQGYDYSLNPYAGCAFACSYCYVRRLPVALFRGKEWGTWVDVKQGAAEKLRQELRAARRKGGTTIFMSSSTDPYQPLEAKEKLTRALLEVMAEEPPDFLFVQTRSPLVSRDIDLLRRLGGRTRVSMTIETDLEPIRMAFTPKAPPLAARFRALKELAAAGVPVQAAVAPLLPCSPDFARKLRDAAERVCVDDFFMGDGSQGRRSEQLGMRDKFAGLGCGDGYNRETSMRFVESLKEYFPIEAIGVSAGGFMP
jgi:DNA repair photolyase